MGNEAYTKEFALEQLKKYYDEFGKIPTLKEWENSNFKPWFGWYAKNFGSITKPLEELGILEKQLSQEERIDCSIKEIIELGHKLKRIPSRREYEKFKNNGFSIYPLQKHLKQSFNNICKNLLPEYVVEQIEGMRTCACCGDIKSLDDFHKDCDTTGGYTYTCKVCYYLNKHNIKNKILQHGWNLEEYKIILDNILNDKIDYINDLLIYLPNKTLEDIVELLRNNLKIANKKLRVKINCAYCGKEVIKVIGIFEKNKNIFCSRTCYWKYKKEFEPKGKYHHHYNRVKTNCTNCNCEIEVTQFNYSKRNQYEDNHNFCSHNCYWEYRSKYYVGEKTHFYGRTFTEEEIDKMRIRTVQMYSNGVFDRETIPQKITNQLLDDLDIKHQREYNCKYYSIDNYLLDFNLMIEVMGDYFHSNHLVFTNINKMQYKNMQKDKSKKGYIKKYYNINMLYLWENDIKNNIKLCIMLIQEYIRNKGVLDDYHSFNYYIDDNKIKLNKNLEKPYFEMSFEYVKSLISDEEKKKISRKDPNKHVTFNCEYCGKEKTVYKKYYEQSKNHFCSKECADDFKTKDRSEIKYVDCICCRKEIKRRVYDGIDKNYFCSRECQSQFDKRNRVKVNCKCCNKEFELTRDRFEKQELHFCSRSCFNDYRKSNNNFSTKKKNKENHVVFNCEHCGKETEQPKYQYDKNKKHFCSSECMYAYGQVKIICKNCETEVTIKKSDLKNGGVFCSRKCQNEYRTKSKTVLCSCDVCGKEIKKSKAKFNKTTHHFCSRECSNKFRRSNKL